MLYVTKANGSREPYDENKTAASIRRAGIPSHLQERALRTVNAKLFDGIPTHDIYSIIAKELSESPEPYSKAKYSLKQAIMMLGPTGYPFEDFIAKIFEEQGYKTKTRQILNGRCVSHEIDVILEKDQKKILVEAKFHNRSGTTSDVKVTLYVKARFDDLKEKHNFDEAWVITNTKTTTDANAYGLCVGLKVISWNYPEQGSLRELIEESNFYPVTILTTIDTEQKARLLANHVILCKDLKLNKNLLSILNLSKEALRDVIDEVNYICRNHAH